jgi:hypothetical protein
MMMKRLFAKMFVKTHENNRSFAIEETSYHDYALFSTVPGNVTSKFKAELSKQTKLV